MTQQTAPELGDADRQILRDVAMRSIEVGLESGLPLEVDPSLYSAALQEEGATFVTLKLRGRLRGCVGSYLARRPLVADVAMNAFASAFRDTRFAPLSPPEKGELELHISLLSPLEPLDVRDRDHLLGVLRPGVDGLLLEDPPRRSTFLPQVWEALPVPKDFLEELLLKAGLPRNHWSSTLYFHRYTVEEL